MRVKVFVLSLVLLLSIAMSISMVSAVLTVRSVAGSAGLQGYRASNDTIIVNVTSTSAVTLSNNNCTFIGNDSYNYYICVITDIVNSPTISYQLRNGDGDTAAATFSVDNGIGAINYNIIASDNGVAMNYSIKDTGFNNNKACTGLSGISVYDDSSMINSIDINSTPGICSYTGTINLSITSTGSRMITLKVVDNVGNVKITDPQNITVDMNDPEIQDDLVIKEAGSDNEIDTISSSVSLPVDIYFTIKEENLLSVKLDLSGINTNPSIQYAYKNVDLPLSNCQKNATTNIYICVVRGLSMHVNSGSLGINVTATDSSGNIGSAILTKTFTIDDIVPLAVIQTDHCDTKNKCYIHDGVNNIIVTLNKQNFDKRYVFFNLPGSLFGINMVQNCTSGVCYANVSLTCTDNAVVETSITNIGGFNSQDDSGNIVQPYNTNLYCDNTAPVIDSVLLVGDYTSGLLVSGKTITLTAVVNESASDYITAYADVTDITSSSKVATLINDSVAGDCTRVNNAQFNCTFSLNTVDDGNVHTVNIAINVTDTVGNTRTMNLPSKTILGFKDANSTPPFFSAALTGVKPNQIDRITLDLAQFNNVKYYVYASYHLGLNTAYARSNVKLLYQGLDVSDCTYAADGDTAADSASGFFQSAGISDIYANISESNRIDIVFKSGDGDIINVNQIAPLTNIFVLSCNISAYVQEGNYIYKQPQIITLKIPIVMKNSKLNTPGEEFASKIKKIDDERANSDYTKVLSTINNAMGKVQQICDMQSYITQAQMAGVAIAATGVVIGKVNSVVGESLNSFGSGLDSKSSVMTQQLGMSPAGLATTSLSDAEKQAGLSAWGFVGQACSFMSCDLAAFGTWTPDQSVASGVNKFASDSNVPGLTHLTENLATSDLKNSIVMSAAKGCLPAIVYNLNKYNQIDCEYLQCLKVYSASGLDISQCDAEKSSKVCSIVVGEAFELPFVRIGTNFFSNTADVIRNSFGVGFEVVTNIIARNVVKCGELYNYQTGAKNSLTDNNGAISTRLKNGGYSGYAIALCRFPLALQEYIALSKKTGQNLQFHFDAGTDICAAASCVGANCYTQNNLLGTAIPPLTPTQAQLDSLKVRKAYGTLLSDSNTLIDAMNAQSKTSTKPDEKSITAQQASEQEIKDIKDWNEKVKIYNDDHGTSIPSITIPKDDEDCADISACKVAVQSSVNEYLAAQSSVQIGTADSGLTSQERQLNTLQKQIDADSVTLEADNKKLAITQPTNYVYTSLETIHTVPLKNTQVDTTSTLSKELGAPIYNDLTAANNAKATSNYYYYDISDGKTKQSDGTILPAGTVAGLVYVGSPSTSRITDTNVAGTAVADRDKYFYWSDDGKNIVYVDAGKSTSAPVFDDKSAAETSGLTDYYYHDEAAADGSDIVHFTKDTAYVSEANNKVTCTGADCNSNVALKNMVAAQSNVMDQTNKVRDDLKVLTDKKVTLAFPAQEAAIERKLDFGLRIVLDTFGFKKFLTAQYWGATTLTQVADALDPQNWVNNLCNPNKGVFVSGPSSGSSTIYQCDDTGSAGCKLVLSFGAERVQYNSTHYIYTITYILGPVSSDTEFNIMFKNTDVFQSGTVNGFRSNKILSLGSILQNATIVISPALYNQMCFQFVKNFPTASDQTTYCRDIKEDSYSNGNVYTNSTITSTMINSGSSTSSSAGFLG